MEPDGIVVLGSLGMNAVALTDSLGDGRRSLIHFTPLFEQKEGKPMTRFRRRHALLTGVYALYVFSVKHFCLLTTTRIPYCCLIENVT